MSCCCRLRLASRYLEVGGVHAQGEGVQLAQGQQTPLQVVDLGHGIGHSVHHGHSVLPDRGGVGAQVLPVGEVGLGLGVHGHEPGGGTRASTRVKIGNGKNKQTNKQKMTLLIVCAQRTQSRASPGG